MRCRCMRPCYRKELFFHVEFLAQESSAKAPVVDVLVGIDEKNYFFIVCTAGSNKMQKILEEDSTRILVVSKGFKIPSVLREDRSLSFLLSHG